MHLEEFPGFKKVDLEWPDLEIVVRQNTTSWRTALSNVAGVYLISDPTDGKLYVGSATGEGGIWARWCQYVDGHGKNIELLQLIGNHGKERARSFRFSILEIADVHASREEIIERESHWKRVLLSRILFFNDSEQDKVLRVLKGLNQATNPDIILIDAGRENKTSASKT